jgi:hypothetical protein
MTADVTAPNTRVLVKPHPEGIGWPKEPTEAMVSSDQPPFRDFVDVEAGGVRACVWVFQLEALP